MASTRRIFRLELILELIKEGLFYTALRGNIKDKVNNHFITIFINNTKLYKYINIQNINRKQLR